MGSSTKVQHDDDDTNMGGSNHRGDSDDAAHCGVKRADRKRDMAGYAAAEGVPLGLPVEPSQWSRAFCGIRFAAVNGKVYVHAHGWGYALEAGFEDVTRLREEMNRISAAAFTQRHYAEVNARAKVDAPKLNEASEATARKAVAELAALGVKVMTGPAAAPEPASDSADAAGARVEGACP